MSIVRVDKKTGAVRPSNRGEIERIVWLNYQYPEIALSNFDAGQRLESPFAYYELRHDDETQTPSSAIKEAA